MATLYEIDARIEACIRIVEEEVIDKETGEIIEVKTEEIIDSDALNDLLMQRQDKLEGVALWYKNLKADADAFKKEKLSFAEKQKAAENKAESLKRYLSDALCGEKMKTGRVQIYFRKSEQVKCEDISEVPDAYLRIKPPELDKTAAKKALKAGEEIPGCRLVENQNIQIK